MAIPDHERQRLIQAATGRSRTDLAFGDSLSDLEREQVDRLVARRQAGEPLQYLEGTVQFGPLELACDARALIPRPETERVWEEAVVSLGDAGPGTVIVDVGTGGGCLALALKHAFPAARVFGTDISESALSLAKENARRTGLEVSFLHGSLLDPLPETLMGRVDLVVSNPPYVAEGEFPALPVEVRDHEPRDALVAGPSGTEVLAQIADEAWWWLGIGGWVLCEIGETQEAEAVRLFGDYDREVRPDLAGKDRILVARKGAPCCA